jgi:hypothetical protein
MGEGKACCASQPCLQRPALPALPAAATRQQRVGYKQRGRGEESLTTVGVGVWLVGPV